VQRKQKDNQEATGLRNLQCNQRQKIASTTRATREKAREKIYLHSKQREREQAEEGQAETLACCANTKEQEKNRGNRDLHSKQTTPRQGVLTCNLSAQGPT